MQHNQREKGMKPIQEQAWRRTSVGVEIESMDGDAVGSIRVEANAVEDEVSLSAAIEALPDMLRALLPLARFVEAFDAAPVRGIDDVLYGIHGGDGMPKGADVRLSDLRKAVAALEKAGVLP